MLLLGLSTGHKIGLGLAVLGFAGFSLIVSMLVPRWYPQFPGRGLRVFVVTCVLLFVGMMAAVVVLARESSEAEAKGPETTDGGDRDHRDDQATTTSRGDLGPGQRNRVQDRAPEEHARRPARTASKSKNDGKIEHDLVVEGNGVDEKTPTIEPGESATLKVDLKPGTYDVYCSIPGHKQAGMDVKLTVS